MERTSLSPSTVGYRLWIPPMRVAVADQAGGGRLCHQSIGTEKHSDDGDRPSPRPTVADGGRARVRPLFYGCRHSSASATSRQGPRPAECVLPTLSATVGRLHPLWSAPITSVTSSTWAEPD